MDMTKEALKIIDTRRLNAEVLARENLEQAMKNTEFAEMRKEYIASVINDAKMGKASENTEKLLKNLEKLLKKLNLGAIKPVYSCQKCNDTGYQDGKMCSCLKAEINSRLRKQSGFGELESFDKVKFDIFENADLMKKVYVKMREWTNSDFKKKIVFLSGGTGTGKTYLLKCMANEIIARGKLARLVTAYKLSQDCLKSHTSRDEEERDELLRAYLECEVLFIDDLGTEVNLSPLTINYIYTILNERKMRGLPTVITTNLSLADIRDSYDERIYSRIADENTIKIQFTGKDLRIKDIKK